MAGGKRMPSFGIGSKKIYEGQENNASFQKVARHGGKVTGADVLILGGLEKIQK